MPERRGGAHDARADRDDRDVSPGHVACREESGVQVDRLELAAERLPAGDRRVHEARGDTAP